MQIPSDVPGFTIVRGSMFHRNNARVLFCPVNCQPGVMGAGLAKAFASRFPDLPDLHREACESGTLAIGKPYLVGVSQSRRVADRDMMRMFVKVVLFPTKEHWQNDARYDWVFSGLAGLYPILGPLLPEEENVYLAIPALGCGLGRLEWSIIANMVRTWAMGLDSRFHVNLYAPKEDR